MKIRISGEGRRLETISKGDILKFGGFWIFGGRTETVREVNIENNSLYTQRTVKNTDGKSKDFPFRHEYVCYKEESIFPNSVGKVYDFMNLRYKGMEKMFNREAEAH